MWDIETGECRQTLEGHSDWVKSVGITPDGRTAISGSDDKTVRYGVRCVVWLRGVVMMSCGVCVQSVCGLCFCLVCDIGVPVPLISGMCA